MGGVEGIPLPSQAVVTTQFRGMDTALLKLMPDLGSLKQPTYRMLRKKMEIFEKACQARGQLVVTEAALMMLNSLEGDNWLAMEDVSLDQFDTMNAFDEFYKVFDRDYQYDPEQELPARMEELVTGFHRQRAEPLRLYVRRLDALVVKLRELKIEWPEPFLGWILLYRSAIPAWQIPNVRSSMGKGFSRIAVRDALYHMFGPDSKPNSRDVLRVTQEAKHTGTEHVNLAADDWADESLEENHEYEFDEWHP